MSQRIKFSVTGQVQGVGYRMFAKARANELGLTGWVKNTTYGGVEGEAQGESESLKQLVEFLKQGPRGCRVDKFEYYDIDDQGNEKSFSVKH